MAYWLILTSVACVGKFFIDFWIFRLLIGGFALYRGPLVVSRMLYCLHSFCEECLDKKLVGEGGDAGSAETTIECPTCGHQTKVHI